MLGISRCRGSRLFATAWLLVVLSGCAHHVVLERSQPGPPGWLTTLTPEKGKERFLGRSVVPTVFDERLAINDAIDDAAYQIARSVVANVNGQATIIDSRKTGDVRTSGVLGESIRQNENLAQSSHRQAVVDVQAIVSGLSQEAHYWEKWSVREYALGPKSTRYRYWVLVSFPSEELKRLLDDVKKNSKTN